MTFIKINHTAGSTYINLDQVYYFTPTSSTDISFYDANSTATSYSFSTADDLTLFLNKLVAISKVIDIDQLAIQG